MINNQIFPRLHTLQLGYYHISSDAGLSALEKKIRFAEMLRNESNDMLEACRAIINKVPHQFIMTEKVKYKSRHKDDDWRRQRIHIKFLQTQEVLKQEEDKRRKASNAK